MNKDENSAVRIIDTHVHVWPDSLVQKNLELITRSSGINPAYNGSVSSLDDCMRKCAISESLINNIVLRHDLLRKANDWTASAVSSQNGLVGVGWLIAGASESVEEAERCAKELGFKGFKMHNSHMKVLPDDPKNSKILRENFRSGTTCAVSLWEEPLC